VDCWRSICSLRVRVFTASDHLAPPLTGIRAYLLACTRQEQQGPRLPERLAFGGQRQLPVLAVAFLAVGEPVEDLPSPRRLGLHRGQEPMLAAR
jgi:hypothetical protein